MKIINVYGMGMKNVLNSALLGNQVDFYDVRQPECVS